jgi:hypothetical protein
MGVKASEKVRDGGELVSCKKKKKADGSVGSGIYTSLS